jgi:hypothetical protein
MFMHLPLSLIQGRELGATSNGQLHVRRYLSSTLSEQVLGTARTGS